MREYRKRKDSDTWHWCKNCSNWPTRDYDVRYSKPTTGELDNECRAKDPLEINVADVVRVSEALGVTVSKRRRRFLEHLRPNLYLRGLDINIGMFSGGVTLKYGFKEKGIDHK